MRAEHADNLEDAHGRDQICMATHGAGGENDENRLVIDRRIGVLKNE